MASIHRRRACDGGASRLIQANLRRRGGLAAEMSSWIGRWSPALLASSASLSSQAWRSRPWLSRTGMWKWGEQHLCRGFGTEATQNGGDGLAKELFRVEEKHWYRCPTKRAGAWIHQLNREMVEESFGRKNVDPFIAGDSVEVRFKSSAESKRENVFRGVVLRRKNAGMSSSFQVLGVVAGTAVEYNIPLYSPMVTGIKIIKKAHIHGGRKRVRRSRIYYLRSRPKSAYNISAAQASHLLENKKRRK